MNALSEQFGEKLSVLAFPCNQFGHQANENSSEFVNTLRYVRPGNGFEAKFTIMNFVDVNGANAHPLFNWMKAEIPFPEASNMKTDVNGIPDEMVLILPRAKFGNQTYALWSPVCRNDIAWNFEKFLINKEGKVVKRYSRYHPTAEIAKDIESLL